MMLRVLCIARIAGQLRGLRIARMLRHVDTTTSCSYKDTTVVASFVLTHSARDIHHQAFAKSQEAIFTRPNILHQAAPELALTQILQNDIVSTHFFRPFHLTLLPCPIFDFDNNRTHLPAEGHHTRLCYWADPEMV